MKKRTNLITAVLFISVLFALSVAFVLLPDRSFSDQENRSLRTLPHFRWERLLSGELTAEINEYFADQFPARDLMVGVKCGVELALGKGENNGILLGRDGQLAQRLFDVRRADGTVLSDTDGYDSMHLAQAINGLHHAAKNSEVPFYALFVGRTIDVTGSSFDYPDDFYQRLWEDAKSRIDAGAVTWIDALSPMQSLHARGEYVYYRTDHHWTTRGAYEAYREIMQSFGMENEIIPAGTFEKKTVSEAFYGTAWSASGMKFVPPDQMEIWFLGDEGEYEIIADGTPLDGFYSTGYLEKKDQYSVFLDGTHDVITVTHRADTARPRLVLFKDSFANSLAPFLARHFDLVLLNLSSAKHDFCHVSKLSKDYEADRILLIYTMENVICADRLERLR